MHVSLECFTITIREKRKKVFLNLTDFDGKKSSLHEIVKSKLAAFKSNPRYYDKKVGVLDDFATDKSTHFGVISSGEYGLASDVYNTKTGKTDYKKLRDHADLAPYFFSISIPDGDRGVMILQRLSKSGIKSLIIDYILEEFEQKYPNHTLEFKNIAPNYVFENYMKSGKVKSITFIKHTIPSDIADAVSGKKQEEEGSVEITVKSKSSNIFRQAALATHLIQKNEAVSFYSYSDFEPDETKIKVSMNGADHTISLNNWSKLRAAFDISDKVKEDLAGYPEISDVSKEARALLHAIASASGIKL